jgi:hypothetical protein
MGRSEAGCGDEQEINKLLIMAQGQRRGALSPSGIGLSSPTFKKSPVIITSKHNLVVIKKVS